MSAPPIDPTQNVLDLVKAAIKRQDDLRKAESRHVREIVALRAECAEEMRLAEKERIDAIRQVDVNAVQRAAEVAAEQATTLAGQVSAAAEVMRTQVEATRAAAATALLAGLEPIKKDIAELREVQYKQAGERGAVVEQKVDRRGGSMLAIAVIGTLIGLSGMILAIITISTR